PTCAPRSRASAIATRSSAPPPPRTTPPRTSCTIRCCAPPSTTATNGRSDAPGSARRVPDPPGAAVDGTHRDLRPQLLRPLLFQRARHERPDQPRLGLRSL